MPITHRWKEGDRFVFNPKATFAAGLGEGLFAKHLKLSFRDAREAAKARHVFTIPANGVVDRGGYLWIRPFAPGSPYGFYQEDILPARLTIII